MEDEKREGTAKQSFRDEISRFSLGSKSKYFSPDRIKPLPVLDLEGESADFDLDGAQVDDSRRPASKKCSVSEVSGSSQPPSKKPSRPYAPPETYAHLARLPDYLKNNLDGELGSHPRELILMNVFCSRLLWYKVCNSPRTSVMP